MKIGFYAGSFDPFTIGHLHAVKLASELFDKVVVGIGINPAKKRRFDKERMKKAIELTLKANKLKNTEVVIYDGYTVHKAKEMGATFLVRGLRNSEDFEIEESLAKTNKEISGMETLYFRAVDEKYVSSSMVYSMMMKNEDVSAYVPKQVIDAIKKEDV